MGARARRWSAKWSVTADLEDWASSHRWPRWACGSVDFGAALDSQLASGALVERGEAEAYDPGSGTCGGDRQRVARGHVPCHDPIDLDREQAACREDAQGELLLRGEKQRSVEGRVRRSGGHQDAVHVRR